MPDTETPTETVDTIDTTTTESVDDGATPTTDDDTDLGDAGKAAIAAEREARRNAEKRLRDLEKSLKAYEDRDKTELQKWQERASEAEKRAEQAEFSALRNKVAASKGVPAASLTGKTEEELDASADELIAWRDQHAKPPATPPAPKRSPSSGGGLKSGATGAENLNPDPKAAAAEALRRLRAGN